MKQLHYYTASGLLGKAREMMIPIDNQFPAQKQIATQISMHLARIQAIQMGADPKEVATGSAFLLGPTGCGKSYIVQSLAEACGLHYAQIDCASLTQAGVRGRNIAHCIADIVNDNAEFFSGGILHLDEADKCFYSGVDRHDAYSPMPDLLKLFEGGDYTYTVGETSDTVNLDKVLVLLSGACAGIDAVVQRRLEKKKPFLPFQVHGFMGPPPSSPQKETEDDSKVTLADLIEYGMMPELGSRINTVIQIPAIDLEGYRQLITDSAKSSALNKFQNLFNVRGTAFHITSEAVDAVAQMCLERDVGARSISAILGERLQEAYNTLDDERKYHKVVLQTDKDGELQVVYQVGDRTIVPEFTKPKKPPTTLRLWTELSSEEDINHFCVEFCKSSYLADISYEPLVYSFLQTVCRYLADTTRPFEHTTDNIIKLAGTTETQKQSSDEHKTPFDILCGDYIKKLTEEDTTPEAHLKRIVFTHYYRAFTREMKEHSLGHPVLVQALRAATQHYQPRNLPTIGARQKKQQQ